MTEGPAQYKGAIKEGKKSAHLYQKSPSSQGKASPKRDLQKEILPQSQAALKWGLREAPPLLVTQQNCLHLCSQGWPGPFPGAESVVQALTQQLPYNTHSKYYVPIGCWYSLFYGGGASVALSRKTCAMVGTHSMAIKAFAEPRWVIIYQKFICLEIELGRAFIHWDKSYGFFTLSQSTSICSFAWELFLQQSTMRAT